MNVVAVVMKTVVLIYNLLSKHGVVTMRYYQHVLYHSYLGISPSTHAIRK